MLSTNKLIKIAAAAKLFMPAGVLAAELPTNLVNTPDKLDSFFTTIASWTFAIFMGVAVIVLIYSAFMFLTSGGDPNKISTARKTLVWAIVAIAIAILAGGIPYLVQGFLSGSFGGGGGSRLPLCSEVPPGTVCIE